MTDDLGDTIHVADGLSPNQRRFLACRLAHPNDTTAAQACGLAPRTVWNWHSSEPAFRNAYDTLFDDGLKHAQLVLRQGLTHAAERLIEGLDAVYSDGTADWGTRTKCATLLLKGTGLLAERAALELSGQVEVDMSKVPSDVIAAVCRWLDEPDGSSG